MAQETKNYWFSGPSGCCDNAHAISWQGWLVVLAYMLVVTGAALLLAERIPIGFASITLVSTGSLLAIIHSRTPGGLSLRLPPGLGGPAPKPPRRSRRRH